MRYFLLKTAILSSLAALSQNISTVAGSWANGPGYNGDSIPASNAKLNMPSGNVATDASGNIYVADWGNNRIRKINALTGIITTVAGTGIPGYNGDSILATSAQIYWPCAIGLDAVGNIYFSDYSNRRIRKIDVSTGLISTIAGTGGYGYNGDGITATAALLTEPTGIALDTAGNIYFSDLGNQRIRKIEVATGLISTIAGNGNPGYNGDSISATSAQLQNPYGIAIDLNGNILIADKLNHRIRKVDISSGLIFTIAGNGISGYNGDNIAAETANLYHPQSVSIDNAGNIYIADEWNNRIRKVNTIGVITTFAGNGNAGYAGDGGPATSAQLNSPRGVHADACGNIYISEYFNHQIRRVADYFVSLSPLNTSCNGLCDGMLNASISGGTPPYSYFWSGGISGGANVANVCSGTYTLSVSDSSGCYQYTSATIAEPTTLSINTSVANATCMGNGTATSVVNGGTPPYSFSWSNGDTTPTSNGLTAGNYILTISDSNNCIVADTITVINDPAPFASIPICMVTVDSLSQFNIITWDKSLIPNADSFIVYREITSNSYLPIGSVPFDSLSQFIDTVRTLYFPNTGDPNAGTYRYKIAVRDTCGSFSMQSPYHNTIYIINNNGTFSWPQLYTIENGSNPVSSYLLMRDDSSNGNWQIVNSVAGTQQTITDPNYFIWQNTASWRVQTQWGISCTPTQKQSSLASSYSFSSSNKYQNSQTSVNDQFFDENTIQIFPSPNSGSFTIAGQLIKKGTIQLYTALGKLIFESKPQEEKIDVKLSHLLPGIYFLHVMNDGQHAAKRILIE